MLKIGGIYTEVEDEYIYIIIEYSKIQDCYLVCQLRDMYFRSNAEILYSLAKENGDACINVQRIYLMFIFQGKVLKKISMDILDKLMINY